MSMDKVNYFDYLQKQIDAAKLQNQPIDRYVKKQISFLQDAHDEFIKRAENEGYDLNSPTVGSIEIQQFSAMKNLAKQIGIPYEKYDRMIHDVRVRVFGEKGVKEYFQNDSI